MKEKDREPAESGSRRQETGDRETGRGRGPDDPTAAWDPDRTLPAPSPAEPAPPSGREPGETFGSYRLETPLGRGGFGEVWEAVHSESGRRVALKLLTSQGETTPEARERFHREARLAASVSHPHCVFLFGAEEVDGRMAVAMEIMEGGTLQDILDAEGRLPYRRAVDAVLDLVDGLEAAHEKGIIHRDIKPSNCFLDASGGVKIGDFGLSKTLEADDALTVTGTYLGTPAYSSPEQVRGREIDFRSDVFSLGALLYHLVTGERPFGSGPATQTLGRILFEDPKPPSEHGVEVPKGLEKVIRRMMAKEPGERFRSYDDLRRALVPFSSRGLAPAALSKRFLAFLLDWSLILFVPAMLLGVIAGAAQGALEASGRDWEARSLEEALRVLSPILFLLYFSLLEGLWGASLGKRLLGLRVREADGAPAGWLRVLARTALLVAVLSVDQLAPEGPWTREVLSLGLVAALVVTMRKRNGYAGLHELLSGTRVTTAPRDRREILARVEEAGEPTLQDLGDLSFGPYQVVQPTWVRRGEELYEGLDPLLHRTVWIHVVEGPTKHRRTGAPAMPGASQSARLQWLQGGAGADHRWDAYERPTGSPLLAWTGDRRSPGWRETLGVLHHLARALAEDEAPERWRLSHVWVEPGGRVRLLPFAWRSEAGLEAQAGDRTWAWQALLAGAARVLLEGRPPTATSRDLRAPMPRSVRRVLERIARSDTETLEHATSDLEALQERAENVSHLRRVVAASPAAVILCMLVGSAVSAAFIQLTTNDDHPPGAYWEIPARLDQWRTLTERAGPEAEHHREAVAALLAHGYLQATTDPESKEEEVERPTSESRAHELLVRAVESTGTFMIFGRLSKPDGPRGLPGEVSHEEEKLLAELASDRETLEPEELSSLRRLAGPTRTAFWFSLSLLAFFEFTAAVVAMVLAGLFRDGLGLRLALIHVQHHDGRPAGRGRCLVRASVVWLPAMLPQIALWVLGPQHPLPGLLAIAVVLMLLVGAIYAILHPTRGLQDRLAGTWLMPR